MIKFNGYRQTSKFNRMLTIFYLFRMHCVSERFIVHNVYCCRAQCDAMDPVALMTFRNFIFHKLISIFIGTALTYGSSLKLPRRTTHQMKVQRKICDSIRFDFCLDELYCFARSDAKTNPYNDYYQAKRAGE